MVKIARVVFGVLSAGLILCGCESREVGELKSENDSLKSLVSDHLIVLAKFEQVNQILDSIDVNRNKERREADDKQSLDQVLLRLQEINDYVLQTEAHLQKIKNDLKQARHEASAYLMMVDALKDEVVIRDGEIEELVVKVGTIEKQKTGITENLKQYEDAIAQLQTIITTRELELSQAKALTARLRASEAEAYYRKAKSVEAEASQIKLAPGKKRETYQEALELYRKAYSLGKEEALTSINLLQKNFPQALNTSHNKRTSVF